MIDDDALPQRRGRGRPAIARAEIFEHPNEMGRKNDLGLRNMRLAWAYQEATANGMTARNAYPVALATCKRRWGIECSVTTMARALKEFQPAGAVEKFIFELLISPDGSEEIRVSIAPRRQSTRARKPRS